MVDMGRNGRLPGISNFFEYILCAGIMLHKKNLIFHKTFTESSLYRDLVITETSEGGIIWVKTGRPSEC